MYDASKSKWGPSVQQYDTRTTRGRRELIYGDMGSGKTWYMGTAPGLFVVDADHGENSKLQSQGIPFISLDDNPPYRKLLGFLTDLLGARDIFDPNGGPQAEIKTLGIDSWTKLNELFLFEICKADGLDLADSKPNWDHYMKLKSRQIIIVKILDDISTKRGINIIVTALPQLTGDDQEKMTKKATDQVYTSVDGTPNLVGAYKKLIGAAFDEVYYLEATTKLGANGTEVVRTLYTSPHGVWQAKTRRVLPHKVVNATFESLAAIAAPAVKAA